MEWNAKSPGQWDWEHLFLFNAKATENPRLQPTDWSAEADGEIHVGLIYPSGGSGCSGSELIHASSSRSTKSASINSSSNGDSKTSTTMFTFEGSQDDSTGKKELSKEEPVETSLVPEPSSASGEPLLTLKLGKRLYFEDVCAGSDSKKPSSNGVPISTLSTGKKCKSSSQNLQHPSCQVEGCGLDLLSAKDYHRKHRVCESHSKSPKVLIAGLERRFCQQCSRLIFGNMLDENDIE